MMWKVRYYVPLLSFVLPTLIIGYGFVIPCSCIAGVNELSVGFGSTVMGAVVTYLAGIRAATANACPSRAPWHVRFGRYLNGQASHPRGWFGRVLGLIWSFEHRRLNQETLDLLDVAPTHRVLDVGCGSGVGVQKAAALASQGHVVGIDVSDVMVDAARSRNGAAVRAGRVEVTRVVDGELGLSESSFDRIFSVHTFYFWKEAVATLRQLTTALRPGGRLVLAFRPEGPSVPGRFRDPTYRFYTTAEVEGMLASSGLGSIRVVTRSERPDSVAWAIGVRPPKGHV
jgi:SAM-dependent methyltransferase